MVRQYRNSVLCRRVKTFQENPVHYWYADDYPAFANIAYVMAKHADGSIPDTPEEWLDGFGTFSIYQVLPKLIELWGLNVKTDAEAKKTSPNRPANDNAAVPAPVCAAGAFYPGSGSAYYQDGERYVCGEPE